MTIIKLFERHIVVKKFIKLQLWISEVALRIHKICEVAFAKCSIFE